MVRVQELFSTVKPSKIWHNIINFPLVRILISIVFLIPPILIHNTIVMLVRDVFEPASYEWFKDVMWIADILLFMLSYYFYTRFVEKRPAHELSKSKAFSETGVGILVGAIHMTSLNHSYDAGSNTSLTSITIVLWIKIGGIRKTIEIKILTSGKLIILCQILLGLTVENSSWTLTIFFSPFSLGYIL